MVITLLNVNNLTIKSIIVLGQDPNLFWPYNLFKIIKCNPSKTPFFVARNTTRTEEAKTTWKTVKRKLCVKDKPYITYQIQSELFCTGAFVLTFLPTNV